MSRATEIIKFLQNYNAWRRGDETLQMPHPAEIGANIQNAIVILREHDELKQRAEQAEAELTTEHDQLRSDCENETKWAAHYLAESIAAKAERDQLRAEVERVRSDRDCEKRLRKDAEEFRENAIERAEKAEAECLEQARLLGKGGEREADLRGKVERLERALLANGSEQSEIKFFDKL